MTSIAGKMAMSTARLVVSRSPRRRTRSTRKADSDRISSSLPTSEAWKLKKPSSIERCEPRAVAPSSITSRIEAIIAT